MTESQVDKYSLDCKTNRFSLKVCLLNDEKLLLELTNKYGPEKFKALLTLDQLKDLCFVFYSFETINESLIIIKNTIESGKIAIEAKSTELIELEFNINYQSVEYPPFTINLLLVENNSAKENENIQENPPVINYKGNQELEANYGNIDYNTTENPNKDNFKGYDSAGKLEADYSNKTAPNFRNNNLRANLFNETEQENAQIDNPEEFLNNENIVLSTPRSSLLVGADNESKNYQKSTLLSNYDNIPDSTNQSTSAPPTVNMEPNIYQSRIYSATSVPIYQNANPQIPIQSIYQPMQRIYRPTQTLYQSIYRPTQSIIRPTQSIYQPIQSIYQPVQSIYQPVQSIYQPTQSIYQPIQSIYQTSSINPIQSIYQTTTYSPAQTLYQTPQVLNQVPQPQINNIGNYYMIPFAQGLNPNLQNSMLYERKYYFPAL